MEASQKYMKDNGILNRISFADGAAHKVKLLKDKVDSIPGGPNGTQVEGMKYLVEENGEQKSFFSGSVGLIAKLAVCEVGDVVTIQMKKANNKSFYSVTKEGGEEIVTPEDGGEIADDEEVEENPDWD